MEKNRVKIIADSLPRDPKLICVTLEYPPDVGGIANYLVGLLTAWPGVKQILVPETHKVSDTNVRPIKFWSKIWPKWWPLVCKLRSCRADLLLISHVLPVGTAAWLAHRLGGPAYAIVLHGLDLRLAKRSRWRRWLLRHILDQAFLIIVNSQFTRQELREVTDLEPLILTPAITGSLNISRAEARARLDLPVDDKIVLTVARLIPRKGIDNLILSVSQSAHASRLVVVGDGPDRRRLENLAQSVSCDVRFCGVVDDQTRVLWYAAADVFALPVRNDGEDVEGFGIVCLEAAAAGLPVVVGRSGGATETIIDGQTGLAVNGQNTIDISTAIDRLLSDDSLSAQFGQAGRERVKQEFSWPERAQCLVEHLPLVSVIIPIWNRVALLDRALDALSEQTYQRFEVIVVDDGSTASISTIVYRWSTRLSIRYVHQEHSGAPTARNHGFDISRGALILFLDADSVLQREALEVWVRALHAHPEASFVYSNFCHGFKQFRGQTFSSTLLGQANYIDTTSMLRRVAFPRFDETLTRFQDWDLWLTMVEQGHSGVWLPRTLFRRSVGGTMSKWLPKIFFHLTWPICGWTPKRVLSYQFAARIVRDKHHLADNVTTSKPLILATIVTALIVTIELLSFLTLSHVAWHSAIWLLVVVTTGIVTVSLPEYGLAILASELIIGSKGALLRFGGDGFGHGGVSLRIGLFIVFTLSWLIWSLRTKAYRSWLSLLRHRWEYGLLGGLLLFAFVRGYILHNPFLLADANGWGYFLLLLPVLSIVSTRAGAVSKCLPSVVVIALGWLMVKTLTIFWLFAHVDRTGMIENIYWWVRRTGVGEITFVSGGLWRVFFQSHIYVVLALVIVFVSYHVRSGRQLWFWCLNVGLWATLVVSLSRSLFLGVICGLMVGILLSPGKELLSERLHKVIKSSCFILAGFMFGFLLIAVLIYLPRHHAGSLSNALQSRLTSEAAVVSRWQLHTVLIQGIKQQPWLGHGFGATLTYKSQDPRVMQTTGGEYTTYAFEWGWLEHWFKLGIVGIPIMLLPLIRLCQRIRRSAWEPSARHAMIAGLTGLAVIHIFTPYLNHPLGIAWLLVCEAWCQLNGVTYD